VLLSLHVNKHELNLIELLLFILSNFLCSYALMLNYLHFKKLYSRLQNFDYLFFINVFKNKINCCSVVDTLGLPVLTRQIRDVYIFNVSNVSRFSPSTRWVTTVNICISLDVFNKHTNSLKDSFSCA
jgi:hypothetical protein